MRALRLVLSLVLIPRLFASLLLFPLILSILLVYCQVLVTGTFLRVFQQNSQSVQEGFKKKEEKNLIREVVFGDAHPRPPIRVCRWEVVKTPLGVIKEVPPIEECRPDRLDVALHVSDPASFNPDEYIALFNGNFERLHLCKTCSPDTIITIGDDGQRTDSFSIWSIALLSINRMSDDFQDSFVRSLREIERIKILLGSRYFHSEGLTKPVLLTDFQVSMAVVLNVASLVVISLWLALKAHRRVLDYFARNGALLPMVAAAGKGSFYSAIWILTLMRVGFFILASIPLGYELFRTYFKDTKWATLFGDSALTFTLWIPALVASLGLATIVASIADLKQRHNMLSFVYRYIPLILCIVGSVLWGVTFIFDGTIARIIRDIIASIPILGVTPVLLAPVFTPSGWVLVIHCVATSVVIAFALRRNARWFAAHLEDL